MAEIALTGWRVTRRRATGSLEPYWSDLPEPIRSRLPALSLTDLGENETRVLAALVRQTRPKTAGRIAAAAGVPRGTQTKTALYRLRGKGFARLSTELSVLGVRRFWSAVPGALASLQAELAPQIDVLVELVSLTSSRLSQAHWRRDWRRSAVIARDLLIYSVALERALDFVPEARRER